MSTKYIASNWRLPNQENSSKNDNYGLTFDGDESINCGTAIAYDEFTLSAWVKKDSSAENWVGIFGSRNGSSATFIYLLGLDNTGKFRFIADGSTSILSDSVVSDDVWYHIVGTADGTTMKMYVNGQLQSSTASYTTPLPTPTNDLMIGKQWDTATQYEWIGEISECCLFDYALSESQISTLYGSSSLGSGNPMALKPQPVAFYPLGDNSSSNPLTQPNVAVEDATAFDSSGGSYITTKTLSEFSVSTSFSFSFWANIQAFVNYEHLIGASNAAWNQGFGLYITSGAGKIQFWVDTYNGSGKFVQSDNNLSTNKWYHIACTYDDTNGGLMYIDGVAQSSGSAFTSATLDANDLDKIIRIFGTTSGYTSDAFMSNAQLWNTELSASEVTTLYNSGVPLYTGTQPQAANLKSWYKLNNTANWEADSSGNWQIPEATSAYPQSFNFDGSDYVNGGNSTELQIADNLTISVWFKILNNSGNRALVARDTGSTQRNWSLYIGTTGTLKLLIRNNTDTAYNTVESPSAYDDGKWHHAAFVYTPSTSLILYVNGVAVDTNTTSITPLINNETADFTIGAYSPNQGYTGDRWTGEISNVQCWNSSLPATGTDSVETLYNNGSPLTTAIASSNLKLWAKLDNNEKFDGTNWSVENQKYPAGFDSALSFDGINDDISITQSNLGTSNTISLWYKSNGKIPNYFTLLGDSTAPNKYAILVYYSTAIYYKVQDASNGSINWSVSNVDDGKWHNFVFARTNTTVNFYIDGNLQTVNSNTLANNDTKIDRIGSKPTLGDFFKGELSNLVIWNSDQSSEKDNIYNNGTPSNSYTNTPVSWWKLNNLTTGIQDSTGSNDGTNNGATKVNTFVSTEAATSSGMTEQSLVNNNVSTLNGESSGMTSANLVTSDLTRAIPYDNYSMEFDGTDQYIDITNTDLGLNNTTSIWFKRSATGTHTLLGSGSGGSWNNYTIQIQSTGKIRYANEDINYVEFDNATTQSIINTTDTWINIIIIRNGADANLYVNSVDYDGTKTFSSGTTVATVVNTIAASGGASGGEKIFEFAGKASNISLFNEALTSTEVQKLYANGVPQDLSSFTPQPQAWYPLGSNSFWNGSAWTCRDMIGSNDGTSANIGADGLVGDVPRSEANGTGTNMDVPSNLEGNTKWSSNNSYSVNMSSLARVEDVA